ncbi:hypothetical protein GGR92_002753 [Spirosoma lacussanchae]|uniref:hypothetical protein n=1 Tax=Spirosoma lacussanchae TaxID=1884249 RepID=UPI0011089EDF|nr:hypothetical protein [Spirosoma lacussanchae]
MKQTRLILFLFLLGTLLACTQTKSADPIDSQLPGTWTLVRTTYGLTQLSVTPAQTGRSETLTFNADGTYRRVISGTSPQPEQSGRYYTGSNPGSTAEKQAIFYPDEQTAQPYSFRDGHLFLYERQPIGATIADGSTYEFKRQ